MKDDFYASSVDVAWGGGKTITVPCLVSDTFPYFAVHHPPKVDPEGDDPMQVVEVKGLWRVTHRPTGLRVHNNFSSRTKAVRYVRLISFIFDGWGKVTPDNSKELCGQDVLTAIRAVASQVDEHRTACLPLWHFGKGEYVHPPQPKLKLVAKAKKPAEGAVHHSVLGHGDVIKLDMKTLQELVGELPEKKMADDAAASLGWSAEGHHVDIKHWDEGGAPSAYLVNKDDLYLKEYSTKEALVDKAFVLDTLTPHHVLKIKGEGEEDPPF